MSDWDLDQRRIEQREHPNRGRRKKIDKPFRVCWRWRERIVVGDSVAAARLGGSQHSRPFATRELAEKFIEKEQRYFSCHPTSGKPWGPEAFWIEGPDDAQSD